MSTRRRRLVLCVLVSAACASVPAADAAGPPLPAQDSGDAGAVAPGGSERIVTRRAGDDTVVTAIRRGEGTVLRSRVIPGRWHVPPVALDNATTGLSVDGRTVVLVRPTSQFPPASTRLAIVDARGLAVRREISLPGFFTVDAISPDGGSLYLIQYAGENVLDYRVRALDTRTGRLAARDIVDPRDPGERMGGLPLTRAYSPDGRWAYTLYGGQSETFIHALDTVGRSAACIDLDMIAPGGDLSRIRLRVTAGGDRISVRDHGRLAATVDARTFAVAAPGDDASAPRPDEPARNAAPAAEQGVSPGRVLVLALGVVACGLVALAWRRRGGARRQALGARVGSTGAGPGEA
jgi:hypothetical protein